MLSRVSSALQTAADVLAPPASRLEDFEYHWKLIQNYYHTHDDTCKEHIEETNIPHHLYQMLQLLVEEESEQPESVGPCAERLVSGSLRLLDGVSAIASAERPPGARALVLAWCTSLLRRLRQPIIHHATVYRPVQRILCRCGEGGASPTEKEEVELLLTLCGLVRRQPGLANIFTTPYVEQLRAPEDALDVLPLRKVHTPKKNPLFEFDAPPNPIKKVSIISHARSGATGAARRGSGSDAPSVSGDDAASCRSQRTVFDDNDKFLLIDLLLTYLDSADNYIVLRACEGIMIVSSLPDADIANLVSGCSSVCESLIHKLADKYKRIPVDMDVADVDRLTTSWGYVAQEFSDKSANSFHGHRELASFLSWLDYCDTLTKECHANIAAHLARTFRQSFLEGAVEAGLGGLHHAVLVTAIVSKCLKVIDSADLINEISNWLVGDGESPEWPLLHKLIDNCLSDRYELSLETLRFFETIIEKPTEHSLQRLVLCQLSSRGYLSASGSSRHNAADDDDERDRLNAVSLQQERDRNRQAMQQLQHEGHVNEQISELLSHEGLASSAASTGPAAAAPAATVAAAPAAADNIHRVINSFLLLLPKAILSDPLGVDYQQYIHDAHRHYQAWLDITSTFHWPGEPGWHDNTASSTHSYDSRPEADHHLAEVTDKDDEIYATERTSERKHSARSTHETPCCTLEDMEANRIGKCGRPAALCPFSQHLVLRSRDLGKSPERDVFDEGPFLRMLFRLLSSMTHQPYQINLQLTSIVSKLAMLPHPNLHEYLLNPMLPTAKNTQTLFKVLQAVGARLTAEIPRVRNYTKVIESTRLQLLGDDHTYHDQEEHNQLFESLIVLEEFCKELAAIAFVKYQHRLHADR